MAHWTTTERRKLFDVHKTGCPTRAEIVEMFPRHTLASILRTIHALRIKRNARVIRRLRIAHEYFSKRESESRSAKADSR